MPVNYALDPLSKPLELPTVEFSNPVASATPSFEDLRSSFLNDVLGAKSKDSVSTQQLSPIYTKGVNSDRYSQFNPGLDMEDTYAKNQGFFEKAKNGVLKGAGLAATTFVNGTAGLVYGAGKWIEDGRFSSLFDNELSRKLDEINTSMEDSLSNYYTNKETNADWYSPDNFFTANFLWDKLVKNAGFSVGAIGGGMAWTKALSIIGKATMLTKAGQSIKPLVTALEEANTIVDPIQRASKIASITEGLSLGENITLGAMKAGANSNRIITSLMGTFGEAGIESLQALNAQRKELIDQYTLENGFAPTGDDLKKINDFADRTGNTVFALNSALLTGTNYIQLPKILGSKYSASKFVSNGVEKELNALTRETSGEVVTAFSKMSKPARILTKTKNALGVVFSPSESFEEGSQFAISEGVGNYYKKKYENKGELNSFLNDLGQGTLSKEGLGFGINQVINTKEGMESLLLGGLSGGLMQSGIISKKGIGKTGELGQRGFFGQGGERGKNTQEAIVALNKSKISEALADQARTQNAGINIAKDQAEALKQDDRYSFKNSEADYTFNYLQSRIKYGKIDWVLEDVKQYKTLATTEAGREDLKQQGVIQEGQSKEEFLQNLNKLEQDAKFVNETYKRVNLSYGGKVSSKDVAFTPEHLEALTYLQYKMKDISDRSADLTAKVGQYGISINDYIQEFVDKKELSNESLEKFEKELKANTRIPDDVQDEVIDNFTSVLKLEKDYKNFLKEYNEITKNPGYLTEQLKTMNDLANKNTDTDTVPATVQLTSVLGEQRFNLNKPYTILEEDADKFGLPKSFTVVQENPDGTLIIKDRLGKKYSVSKEALAPFRFAKNDETTGDKKGTFLYTVTPEEIEQKKKEDAFLADAKKVNEVLKENENIEIASGDVITSDATTTTGEIEPGKKTASAYFHTSKEPTIEDNNLTGMAKKRQNLFYAIKKSSRKFVAAFITPALQEKLNLPNVLDLLYDADKIPGNHADDSTGKATIGQVYLIEAPSGDLYYTDEDGNPLKRADNSFIKFGDVLTEQEKQKLVLSVSPSLETESARGPVYRAEQKEEFYKNLELYKQERKDLLAITDTDQLPIHKVAISKGFLIFKDIEGNPLPGVHVSNLITEEVIKTKSDVITVPRADGTTDLPTGEKRNVKAGFPMLNFGGQLYNLNNRQLTTKEKENIKDLLVALASRFQFGNRKLDRTILSYIQHILYYGQGKSETFKNNQIAIVQEEDRTAIPTIKDGVEVYPKPFFLKMGPNKVKFDKASVNSVEGLAAIDTFLDSAYTNVNIKTIDTFANDKFVEITGIAKDKDGNLLENKDGSYRLETLTWPNYRTFLLSSKKPDGKARPVEETPLTIKMITPQEGVKETPIVDQYAIFTDKKFKEPAPVAKTEVAPTGEITAFSEDRYNKIKQAIDNEEELQAFPTDDAKLKVLFSELLSEKYTPEELPEQVAIMIARYNFTKQQQEAATITSEFGNIGIMDFDPTDTGAPFEEGAELKALEQPFTAIQTVEYKGNSYTVDMTAGTVTNPKGKVIKSTSPVGKKVLDLVNWEDSSEKAKALVLEMLSNNGRMITEFTPEEQLLVATVPIEERIKLQNTITPKEDKDLNKIDSETKEDTGVEGAAKIDDLIDYRREFSSTDKPMSNTDWSVFRQWVAEKLPNMPIYELEEMIRIMGTDRKAWGMLKDNALHIFKYAPKGTEYHEAFEFVWNRLLSVEEQAEIIAELKANNGTFFDIITEKRISFSKATTEQLKEFAAERFASYKKGGETVFEKLNNFFSKVMSLIKNFFVGNKFVVLDQLFADIQSGKFKNATVNNSTNVAFKKAPRLTELETKSLVDTGYVLFLLDISKNGPKGVYTLNGQGLTDQEIIVSKLQERLAGILVSDNEGGKISLPEATDTFDAIVENVKSKLKSLGISFEKTVEINPEEEDQTINDEGRNKNDYAAKEMKIDHRKGAFPIIKLAYSKLYETIKIKATRRTKLQKAKAKLGEGNSLTPVEFGKSFITTMKSLSPVLQLDKVNQELITLAKKDSNFTRLLQDLGFDFESQSFNYEGFDHYQWQQSIQHFVTFAKQNPTAVNFITTEGNVTMQNAVLQRPTELIKNQWLTNIKVAAKGVLSPISFNVKTNKFSLNTEVNNKYQNLQTLSEAKEYLADLGIIFSEENILDIAKDNNQTSLFLNTARDINKYLMPEENFKISPDTLSIGGPLQKLAELHVNLNTETFNSTYYTLSGTSKQQFDNHNFASKFEVAFNSATTREELYKMMPHLKDSLAKNSIFLRENDAEFTNEYWNENGERTEKPFKISIFNEIKDNEGNVKTQDSLDLNERVTYQINNLLNENHYIILPADSATEWMTTFSNPLSIKAILDGTYDSILTTIFKGYLQDEIAVASESIHRSRNENVTKNGAKDLRILKDMLSQDLLSKVTKVINEEITFDEFWAENQEQFKTEIISHLKEKREAIKQLLIRTGEVTSIKEGDTIFYTYANLDDNYRKSSILSSGYDKNKMTEEDLNALLDYFSTNYALSNTELFKVLFGDPYQFKIATKKNGLKVYDVFKRIKSWLSPRRTLFTDSRFDVFANAFYNTITTSDKERAIRLEPKDLGYNTFSHLKTSATIALSSKNGEDVVGSMVLSSAPKEILKDYYKVTEADASSGITIMKYREVKIKTGQWDFDTAEVWYQQEMAYARQQLAKKEKYTYTSSRLKNSDEELARLRKPTSPEFITDVLKPIITGPKESAGYNEQELDKTSMMPIFYSMTEVMSYDEETRKDIPASTILQDLFLAMVENNVDYYTFPSGKKVGITDTHYVYNEDGSFNTEIFKDKSITVAPLDNLGIQVETMYQGGEGNTVGSQATKVISMDLLVGGYPSDAKVTEEEWAQLSEEEKENSSPIYKLIRLNDKYRRDLVLNGYQSLLNRFGVQDLGDRFEVENIEGLQETIVQELERRNLSDNALSSLELDEEKNKFKANLEASNFYGVIKDVLWSIVRKNIVQPTVSGMQAVQIPVAFFESSIDGKTLLQKTEEGYKKITREEYNALTEDQQKNVKFGSSALSFYTETVMKDGVTKQIQGMEVMLPMWFRDTIKSHKRYGKATDAEILNFLNETEEGKSILQGLGFRIPTQGLNSIEVFKVKAFLPKAMGKSIVVPSEITTKAGSDFDIDKLNTYLYSVWVRNVNKVATITKVKALNRQKEEIDPSSPEAYEFFLNEALFYQNNVEDDLINTLSLEQKALYFQKQAIENKYFETMQQLLLLPENYEKILTPNTTKDLESLSEELADVLGENSTKVVSPLIDFTYIVKMRDAFLTGKKWVGVVATNITGHSLFQKFNAYVDLDRINIQSPEDKTYLGDGIINLPHNTVTVNGKEMTSLSKVRNSTRTTEYLKGQLISDILSQFANAVVDIAKDPFITKIVSSKFTIGPAMFLVRAGVDLKTIGYFLNQPIVREYLENLSQSRTKTVFSDAQIANTLTQFETNGPKANQKMSSAAQLKDNIKQYYVSGVTNKELFNREQRYILQEFLKYAKLAEYNFKITQATNYDTASFRSGDVLYKKELLYKEAQTNMISSAKEMLDATFVGEMRENLNNAQSMMGSIFKTETPFVRNYINRLLNPYALGFTGEEDYLKVGIKLSSSLIDYLVITKSSLLKGKFNALFSGPNNIWSRIQQAKAKGISNLFFDYIEGVVSDNVNGFTSLKLTVNKKDVYEQNQLADALRELKEQDINLYRDVVSAAILQGSAVSPFSFTDIIPIEDYTATVNPIIENITEADLKTYVEENAFQRNNWSDSVIVPKVKPSISVKGLGYFDEYGNEFTETTINNFPNDLNSIINSVNNLDTNTLNYGQKPLLLHKSSQDVIVMNRYQYKEKSYFDMVTGGVNTTIRERLKQNDPSTKEILGYQKVKNDQGQPLVVNNKYVFKAINLKGLGIQGNDYENLTQPSSINNNTYTVKTELPNSAIISYYINNKPGTAYIEMPKQLSPVLKLSDNIENNVYSQLGNKTVSENIVIKSLYQQAGVKYARENNSIFSLRVDNSDEHFGNPFSNVPAEIAKGLIPTASTKESVEKYIEWILEPTKVANDLFDTNNYSLAFVMDLENRGDWIQEQLIAGNLKGKTIIYYKELGEPSHATALDYLINKYDWNKNEISTNNEFPNLDINNSISTFFNSLNAQQQAKLGSLENLQNEYNAVPFAISEEDFINELKCKL